MGGLRHLRPIVLIAQDKNMRAFSMVAGDKVFLISFARLRKIGPAYAIFMGERLSATTVCRRQFETNAVSN